MSRFSFYYVLLVPDFDTKSINIKPIARFYSCYTKYNYRSGLEITSVDLFNFFSILLSELKKDDKKRCDGTRGTKNSGPSDAEKPCHAKLGHGGGNNISKLFQIWTFCCRESSQVVSQFDNFFGFLKDAVAHPDQYESVDLQNRH
jgi:hypothetical protein